VRYFTESKRVRICTKTRALRWSSNELHVVSNGVKSVIRGTGLVLAVPAPQAREILHSLAPSQLSVFRTTASEVLLHSDEKMMPRDPAAWASWNVVGGIATYWLHSIQSCRVKNKRLFVSVMSDGSELSSFPEDTKVIWRGRMNHPMLQHGTAPMQKGDLVFCLRRILFTTKEKSFFPGCLTESPLLVHGFSTAFMKMAH
jgi:predicted NAD/FAD-binding protein